MMMVTDTGSAMIDLNTLNDNDWFILSSQLIEKS